MAGWTGAAGTGEWGEQAQICGSNSHRRDRSWPEPLALGTRSTHRWVHLKRKSCQTPDAVLKWQRGQTGEAMQHWGCRLGCPRIWYNVIDPAGKGREPVVTGDLLSDRHSWTPSHLSITKLPPVSNSQLKLLYHRLLKDNTGWL